jgi:hypothetical protein
MVRSGGLVSPLVQRTPPELCSGCFASTFGGQLVGGWWLMVQNGKHVSKKQSSEIRDVCKK